MSRQRRRRQQQARRAREERARALQRRAQRRRQLLAGVAVVAVLALVAGVFAVGGPDNEEEPMQERSQTVPCPPPEGSTERRNSFPAPPPICLDPAMSYRATFETDIGSFTVALDDQAAPQTVNNFVYLARYRFYDGVPFHRVIPGFVVQGGDGQRGDGTGGPGYTIPDELPPPGRYQVGSLAMANTGRPDTGGSQFFVITGPRGVQLPPQYSLFGSVVDGLGVVQRIEADGSEEGQPRVVHRMVRVTISETPG